MAALLVKHAPRFFNAKINIKTEAVVRCASSNRVKVRKIKEEHKPPKVEPFEAVRNSLSSRGYLRPYKPYEPKQDVATEILSIASKLNISQDKPFDDKAIKFEFLNSCYETLQHSVPNSMLYQMKTVNDVIKFYETPIDTRIPLDKLKTVELPENLHIQYDYVRFNPETDTKFGGVSAFPKSSTIVTGLKYKDKKYSGYTAKTKWP